MKARIKATGEIVNINEFCSLKDSGERTYYWSNALELITQDNPDYWTRLEHQYAGMAMQGMIKRAYEAYCNDCANYENMIFEDAQALLKDHAEALADVCVEYSHTLIQKLKEKEEKK